MIADSMRELRMARRMTQKTLAKKIQCSVQYISNIENGHIQDPGMVFLFKASRALNVSVEYFADDAKDEIKRRRRMRAKPQDSLDSARL